MNQCIVFASSADYDLPNIYRTLKDSYKFKLFRDVFHLSYKNGHVFIFSYGTTVCWLLSEMDCAAVLELLAQFQTSNSTKLYNEKYNVQYSDKIRIAENTIYTVQDSITSMLAISHGLAQSEKLGVFEHSVNDLINEIQPHYKYLAKFGKIALSRRKISKKIGQLFSVRSFINLHLSILDTPDYFWEVEELEPAYQAAIQYLELKPRMHALNAKMSIIQELYGVLHNELQTMHSHRLEWIIIILILMEVMLSILKY